MIDNLIFCDGGALLPDCQQEWTLVPFGMRHGDDGRFCNTRATDGLIFDVDGRNPLATGFNDILGTIGDLHVAVRIDGRHVSGVKPVVFVYRVTALTLKVP